MDPYSILGVQPGASKEDIKRAYRKKVLSCHPDKHHNSPEFVKEQAAKEYQSVSAAYEQLQNPTSRRATGASTGHASYSSHSHYYRQGGGGRSEFYKRQSAAGSSRFSTLLHFLYTFRQTGSLMITMALGGVFVGSIVVLEPLLQDLWMEKNREKLFENMIEEVQLAKARKLSEFRIKKSQDVGNSIDERIKSSMKACFIASRNDYNEV